MNLGNTIALWCNLVVCLLAVGCSGELDSTDQSNNGRINIVATTGMVADLVREIGGDEVNVIQLMGSGIDPHLYRITRDDRVLILDADIVFYSGMLLEGKMTEMLENEGKKKPVVAVTNSILPSEQIRPKDAGGHPDPHAWMDVSLWQKAASVVEQTLSEFAPDSKSQFSDRAADYQQQLSSLHEYGQKVIGSIPEDQRILLTSHDAFQYLGRAYEIEVQGVQGISTQSEAGLKRINELVDLIVERKVKAVFVESSVSPKNIQALVDGAKSKRHDVQIGGELFSDAFGELGTYEGTYLGMLDHNLTLISKQLGGQAPTSGLNGKLSAAND